MTIMARRPFARQDVILNREEGEEEAFYLHQYVPPRYRQVFISEEVYYLHKYVPPR
jgi:hypothetical protein